MSYKKLLQLICVSILILSCNDEQKTTFSIENITTPNNKLVEIHLPKVVENTEIATSINKEISQVVVDALQIGEAETNEIKTIEESIDIFNNEFEAFNNDFPEIAHPWESQIDGEVMLQTPEIISIAITSYINTGGAHGITNIRFLNFDPATGKRLQNNHLIKNLEAFTFVAHTYFKKKITEADALFEPDTFILPENIGFNETGVILLYNQYEIAPYSTGIIDFTVPMAEVRGFLTFNGS